MKLIAGVDIGNSTTEACIGRMDETGRLMFMGSAMSATTGIKGTPRNVDGVQTALRTACRRLGITLEQIEEIRINEASPVIGDTALETVTETVISGSAMIGHNPGTPAGIGIATGILERIERLDVLSLQGLPSQSGYILLVPACYGYEKTAGIVNSFCGSVPINGLILQNDEAVLVWNRLHTKLPIVDEVTGLADIPTSKLAAIEVAPPGESVRMLSNPYGIATTLQLTPEETKAVVPIAKSLIGKKSGVVIKSPGGKMAENILPAGELLFHGDEFVCVDVDAGGEKIMDALHLAGELRDVTGRDGTNIGKMIDRVRKSILPPTDSDMHNVSGDFIENMQIKDLLAVDILTPVPIAGAAAGETCLEKAVAVAAMVKAESLPMKRIADKLARELGVLVEVAGVEAVMAILGALTTPGATFPLTVLDMGGGSTDIAHMDEKGVIRSVHLAGAGELVTLMIQTELGLVDKTLAEQIKRYPAAKVESLHHVRLENGGMLFFDEPLAPKLYGRTVLLDKSDIIRIDDDIPMERVSQVRREAKQKVFITNAIRGLDKAVPGGMKKAGTVVLVGGSAADFELPGMLTLELSKFKILCGQGNIRRTEGPRNAVATGLLMY